MSDAVKTGKGAKKAKARGSPKSRVDKDVQFLYAFINVMVDKVNPQIFMFETMTLRVFH
jgi:hypothetical protein